MPCLHSSWLVSISFVVLHVFDMLSRLMTYYVFFSPLKKLGLVILIGSLEYNRALQAFAKPEGEFSFQQLNEDHYPGDIGFDPLG